MDLFCFCFILSFASKVVSWFQCLYKSNVSKDLSNCLIKQLLWDFRCVQGSFLLCLLSCWFISVVFFILCWQVWIQFCLLDGTVQSSFHGRDNQIRILEENNSRVRLHPFCWVKLTNDSKTRLLCLFQGSERCRAWHLQTAISSVCAVVLTDS